MSYIKLKDNVFYIGVQDPNLRIFDIVMYTEYGTSYNSYLIKGSEKTALIETVKDKFFDRYLDNIKQLIDVKDINYLIVNHTEPDHAGAIEKLLELNNDIKIYGSSSAIKFLKKITNKSFDSEIVKEDDIIDLGDKQIRIISAPFLHWPDSIYSYLIQDKILFTCDSFGCHYSFDNCFVEDVIQKDSNGYFSAYKYYYDVIMSPFKNYVLQAIDKIKNIDIDIIATGHGPIITSDKEKLINLYKEWSTNLNNKPTKPYLVILYVSAYGYTEKLAKSISEGIKSHGIFDVHIFNLVETDIKDVLEKIYFSEGILIGSPTINADALKPIYEVLINLNPIIHGGKFAAAFGSYGWSGEAVGNIESRLKQLKFKLIEPGLKVNFKPNSEEVKKAFDFGYDFSIAVAEKLEVSNNKK